MLFNDLEKLPPDPILGMAQVFAADPSPHKVDLGIGIYKDEHGAAPILRCVKAAERWLVENQTTKAYLSSAGNPTFNLSTLELLFGATHPALTEDRVRTVQTPGGTGALRVAADFVRSREPTGTVWLPEPTWANHAALFAAAGLTVAHYPYYEADGAHLLFDQMLDVLGRVKQRDVVLLHGCCHNPTGADLSPSQWDAVVLMLERTGATPFVDFAYQGFGEGVEADAYAIRALARQLPELIIASSYSKNFALYRDRVGALTLVSPRGADADLLRNHVMRTIRTNYSMPPDHGAAVIAHILGDPARRSAWELEVTAMSGRIREMRQSLALKLRGRTATSYDFIAHQKGMFTALGLQSSDVLKLRQEHHIHISSSGRINVAGLTASNVAHVADALVAIHPVS